MQGDRQRGTRAFAVLAVLILVLSLLSVSVLAKKEPKSYRSG